MLLSICIPTYERTACLNNCLNSIYIAKKNFNFNFEVCVSDNCSSEDVGNIIKYYRKKINIKYKRQKKNLGLAKNILSAVSMAKGKYSWIIGNDELLLPYTFFKLDKYLNKKNIDFFFINSFHLDARYTLNGFKRFNTYQLPKKMKKFSDKSPDSSLKFFDLINPDVAFDFLTGMYLCIFNTSKWKNNLHVVNKKNIKDVRTYSTFDNTCVHVKVFAKAFAKSQAFFVSNPLSVNLFGVRDWWVKLYSFVDAVRIPEVVDEYRKNGLPFIQYLLCKNYALRNFIPCLVKILLNKKESGYAYVSFKKHIVYNLLFPNVYLSFFYFIKRFFIKKIKFFFN